MRKPRLLLAAAIILGTTFFAQSKVRELRIVPRNGYEGKPFISFRLGDVDEITITPYDEASTTKEVKVTGKKPLDKVSPRLFVPEWETMKIFNDTEEVKAISLQDKMISFIFLDENLRLNFWGATDYIGNEEFPYESFTRIVLNAGIGGITGVAESPQNISVVYDDSTEELKIASSENISNVRVYNMQGMCVRNIDAGEISERQSVSMSGLSSGIYVAEVVSENGVITSKIAKK